MFVVLLWPLMVVAAILSREGLTARSKYLLYVAITIFVIEPFLPGSKLHRLLEIGGLDFLATSLLAAGLLIACVDASGRPLEPSAEPQKV